MQSADSLKWQGTSIVNAFVIHYSDCCDLVTKVADIPYHERVEFANLLSVSNIVN